MQDRVSLYPGRVKLAPVPGQENTFDLVRADQPTQEGTPLNKASLLKDATAAILGLPVRQYRMTRFWHWHCLPGNMRFP